MAPIRVLHVGLGPIGVGVARQIAARPWLRIVGAVDVDPEMVGRDLAEVAALDRPSGVTVTADLRRTIRATRPDVAILCTQSSLAQAATTFEAVLSMRVPIVSTTEELSYPTKSRAALARRIDTAARRAGVAVLGTGVNPGFVMDALPIALTSVCDRVDRIRVDRVQDARVRRLPFQQKIGAGLSRAAFRANVAAGSVRHVGLAESIAMIADALGWKLDRVTDTVKPKMARTRVASRFLTVQAGQVAGLVQDGIGYRQGKPVITLHMEAYLGAPESYDAVRISGLPALSMKIAGGVHGDIATVAMVVNSIPKVIDARPGLRTMRDMVLPAFEGGRRRSVV